MSHTDPPPPEDPEEKGFFENLKDSFSPLGDSLVTKASKGRNRFFVAINRGDVKTITDMVTKENFDPDTYNLGGMGALHQAVISGKMESVKALLDLGANPDLPAKVMDKITPMALAIEKGRADMTHLLAENGADIYRKGASGWTYAHQATEKNNPEMIRELIACGLDPCVASDGGITPLEMAVSRSKREAAQALLSDARVARSVLDNKSSPLPMMIAEKGDLALTSMFICAGFPPNFQDISGVSLLHVAALNNDLDMVKMLVAGGADINKAVTAMGNTPLHAAAACKSDNEKIIRHLIEAGANAGLPNNAGQTPLHLAFMRAPTQDHTYLVQNMQDINAIDGFGMAPLHLLATKGGNRDMALALIQKGADVNLAQRRSGETALHLAAKNKNLWLTELLLQNGANPFLKDSAGNTATYYARLANDSDIVKALEKSLDDMRSDKFGKNQSPAP